MKYEYVSPDVGMALLVLRKLFKMSQKDLAIVTGKQRPNISRIERGINSAQITLKSIELFAAGFGISPSDFIELSVICGMKVSSETKEEIQDEVKGFTIK